MSLGLKESLPVLVKAKYRAAKASGALTFADSYLAVLHVAGVPFQLRYCPSLAKKPNNTSKNENESSKNADPFDSPSPDMHVCDIPTQNTSHLIVLNKFPIIQNHFILATKSNKQQTHLLEPPDLSRTYQCLKEWGDHSQGEAKKPQLFAFFNSGNHSGASQPHRHLQFLPVDDMKETEDATSWALLVDSIVASSRSKGSSSGFRTNPKLPFVHFGQPLPKSVEPDILWTIYTKLYAAAALSVRRFRESNAGALPLHSTEGGNLPISYNLAMTTEAMVICPRRQEGQMVRRKDGSDIDAVILNGTVLGGTLMVKNEELYELLRNDPSILGSVLSSVGIPAWQGYDDFDASELDRENFSELKGHVSTSGNL